MSNKLTTLMVVWADGSKTEFLAKNLNMGDNFISFNPVRHATSSFKSIVIPYYQIRMFMEEVSQ